MEELDFHPEMVSRDKELNELQSYLDQAAHDRGNTVFISGEAGIGKTRLVNEMKSIAKTRGFKILSGNSLAESLTPYMPFFEALRSGNLENLFSQEAPRIEGVYLITHSGLLVEKVLRKETALDPEIFASMLTTVSDFIKDSLSLLDGENKEGILNSLGFKNYRILVESGKRTNLVVILTGRENEFLIEDMRNVLLNVDELFGSVLRSWRGNMEELRGIDKVIETLITRGKYDGIYYGSNDPKDRRNMLFENVSLGLKRQARSAPTLLCIEDLHWADPSSLALIHYVARNSRECGLLILGTYRPEDVIEKEGTRHPLIDTMRLMNCENLYKAMELRRLSEETVVEFLLTMLGEIDFSEEFRNRIFQETEGNPFFMIELIKLLIEENTIVKSNGAWKIIKELKDVRIPSKIHDVILRRLNRLEREERKVLDYASVIGEVFTSAILATALGMERVRLLEQIRLFEQKHRLIHSDDRDYRFDHSKIREVLYSEIPEELRSEYHAIIANSIEAINKENLDAVTGDLAFHYYYSKSREKALHYLTKGAERARKEYSNVEAIRFYTNALELADDKQEMLEINKNLGDIYQLISEYEKGIEHYKEAINLADDMKTKSELQAKLGRIYTRQGRYNEAIDICTKGLEAVRGKDCREEALCLGNIGLVYRSKGEYDRALEFHEKSLAISENIGDQQGIANSLNNIGTIHHTVDDYGKALHYYEKSLIKRKKIGDQLGIAHTLNNIGVVHFVKRDFEKALEFYKKSMTINEKIGSQDGMAGIFNSIGVANRHRGNYDQALEFFKKSLTICEKIGFKSALTFTYCELAETYLKKKELNKALEFCEKGLNLSKELGAKGFIGYSRRIFGMIYSELKGWDLASDNFQESIRIFKDLAIKIDLGESYYEYGLMLKAKGEEEKAEEHLKVALTFFEEMDAMSEVQKVKKALKSLKTLSS